MNPAILRIGLDVVAFAIAVQASSCVFCGCTEFDACPGGCAWIEIAVCSACQGIEL